MYLKALEIHGFKSFPEKTRLTFEKPVTCIVGPNGSGKSNISDAILWVTGEQSSKALRGGKMEDVIFGGTQKRGPMGYAEVSLIFDNSHRLFDMDNSEVMITRRYYRSGDSEYYINKQSVRLRDVNELLMDTGMGHEGYSIIGQGKIDSILSAKSTDRREIFEEAAGISRYRHRKEEAQRKLQRTDENLVRINDKIAELEMQVEPLRKQSETAKRYLVLRDEMRELEISVWLDSLDRLKLQQEQLQGEYINVCTELEKANSDLAEIYEKSNVFSEKMREKDMQTESLRDEISSLEERRSALDSAGAVLKANLDSTAGEIQRIEQELVKQREQDSGIEVQICQQRDRIAEIDSLYESILDETEKLNLRIEQIAAQAGQAAQELNSLISCQNEQSVKLNSMRSELSALASTAQALEDRDTAIAQETASSAEKLRQFEKDKQQCFEQLKTVSEQELEKQNQLKGYSLIAGAKKQRAEAAAERLTQLKIERNSITSRVNMLTEMEKEYQGYSRAVKTVMQDAARGVLKNVHGTAAQLMKTEEKYAVAIETALGAAMQNIIVSTEQDAKAGINMLKRRDCGRATFMPMSFIHGSVLNERGLENEPGFEGIAVDLISFDGKYRNIYNFLLGRTAVAGDIDDAINISRKYSNRFRIVTLDGQVINAGGTMTGGSTSKNAGIISRSNELEKLRQQAQLLSEDMLKAEKEAAESQRELVKIQQQLEVCQSEKRELENQRLKLENDVRHYELFISSALEAEQSQRQEAAAVKEKIEANSNRIAEIKRSIAQTEIELDEVKKKIDSKSAGQEDVLAEREKVNMQISALRSRGASLAAEKNATENAVSQLSALRGELSGGREQQLGLIDSLKSKSSEICNEIEKNEMQSAAVASKINAFRQRIGIIAEEKLMLEAERTKRDKQLQQTNSDVLNFEREKSRLEQKKLAAEMESKQIIDKLWDTYELSRTDAAAVRKELEDYQQARKRITELKKEISKLGNPNIGAIEEFERVNTRYTYLAEQRDDVENAKTELLDIISSVTSEMEQIFVREFNAINESFKQTFTELFGGGKANLELEDENDVLECGIEIKIQPPGKSLKTITLLSGGEKAFVAIALYFAILKVRPTPFVIMDEIEAALDEANVLKVAAYMRRMSDKTQMIVITHRRGTMEEADVLYGVTMQEKGVSKILNIDLDEAEKTIAK